MKSLVALVPAAIFIIFSGCDLLDSSTDARKNLTYPLDAGNKWEYDREFGVYNFRTFENPDSVIKDQESYVYANSTVLSNGTVDLDEFAHITGAITELEQKFIEEGHSKVLTSWNYYTYKDDGLYLIGYRSASGASAMPKIDVESRQSANGFYIFFDGVHFSSVHAVTEYVEYMTMWYYDDPDDLIIEKHPVKVIPRNMQTGKQWTARTKGNPWRVDKRILGRETIEVPAGQYECYKVQWLVDPGNTGEWNENLIYYDYFSEDGLIKREFYFKDLIWSQTDHSSPTGYRDEGYFDGLDISILTGFE